MTHSKGMAAAVAIVQPAMNELLPLYDAAEMRALDRAAIDGLGIPAAVLMERAGLAAAHEILQRHADASRAAVVAGTGNNGGDGFVGRPAPAGGGTRRGGGAGGRRHSPQQRRPRSAGHRRADGAAGAPASEAGRAAPLCCGARTWSSTPCSAPASAAAHGPSAAAVIDAGQRLPGGRWWRWTCPPAWTRPQGTVAAAAVRAAFTVSFHGPKLGC